MFSFVGNLKLFIMEAKEYLGHKVFENGTILIPNGKIVKQRLNKKGYPQVTLRYNGKDYCKRVHRMLAELFIPNPDNKPQVNHKDRNRENYSINNLEWVTAKENCIHSVLNGGRLNWTRNTKGSKNPNSKLCDNDVLNIRYYFSEKLLTQKQLAEKYKVNIPTINKIVNRKRWNIHSLNNEELTVNL